MGPKKFDLDLLDDDPESRFVVESMIGEGTFGEVHKALDTKTNRHVAIKIFDNLDENVEEIQEEFAVLSTHWIHPNIPHFVGIFLRF
jgi:serine/threonine protein kinase